MDTSILHNKFVFVVVLFVCEGFSSGGAAAEPWANTTISVAAATAEPLIDSLQIFKTVIQPLRYVVVLIYFKVNFPLLYNL